MRTNPGDLESYYLILQYLLRAFSIGSASNAHLPNITWSDWLSEIENNLREIKERYPNTTTDPSDIIKDASQKNTADHRISYCIEILKNLLKHYGSISNTLENFQSLEKIQIGLALANMILESHPIPKYQIEKDDNKICLIPFDEGTGCNQEVIYPRFIPQECPKKKLHGKVISSYNTRKNNIKQNDANEDGIAEYASIQTILEFLFNFTTQEKIIPIALPAPNLSEENISTFLGSAVLLPHPRLLLEKNFSTCIDQNQILTLNKTHQEFLKTIHDFILGKSLKISKLINGALNSEMGNTMLRIILIPDECIERIVTSIMGTAIVHKEQHYNNVINTIKTNRERMKSIFLYNTEYQRYFKQLNENHTNYSPSKKDTFLQSYAEDLSEGCHGDFKSHYHQESYLAILKKAYDALSTPSQRNAQHPTGITVNHNPISCLNESSFFNDDPLDSKDSNYQNIKKMRYNH